MFAEIKTINNFLKDQVDESKFHVTTHRWRRTLRKTFNVKTKRNSRNQINSYTQREVVSREGTDEDFASSTWKSVVLKRVRYVIDDITLPSSWALRFPSCVGVQLWIERQSNADKVWYSYQGLWTYLRKRISKRNRRQTRNVTSIIRFPS